LVPLFSPAAIIDLDISVLFQLALFLVLLVVLSKLVFKPLLTLFQQRQDETDGKQEEAVRAANEAEGLLDGYSSAMAEATADGMAVRNKVRDEAVKKEADAVSKARSDASAWYEGELASFGGELEQARSEAHAGVSRLSGELVDMLVSRSLGERGGDTP